MTPAVILYGPPASGKDSITSELVTLDSRYVRYQRLKVGGGKSEGYRIVDARHLRTLEAQGAVLYRNSRYGNVYAVDRDSLASLMDAGRIPVLHLGQIDGITAVEVLPARWVRVLLWCERATTAKRVAERGDRDVNDRLQAWDETHRDLQDYPGIKFDAIVRTDEVSALDAARTIHAAVEGRLDRRSTDEVLRVGS